MFATRLVDTDTKSKKYFSGHNQPRHRCHRRFHAEQLEQRWRLTATFREPELVKDINLDTLSASPRELVKMEVGAERLLFFAARNWSASTPSCRDWMRR